MYTPTPVEEIAYSQWPHCRRCGTPMPDNYEGICADCMADAEQKASSYGGTETEVEHRLGHLVVAAWSREDDD